MKLKKRNDVFFVCVEMKENADRVNPSIEEKPVLECYELLQYLYVLSCPVNTVRRMELWLLYDLTYQECDSWGVRCGGEWVRWFVSFHFDWVKSHHSNNIPEENGITKRRKKSSVWMTDWLTDYVQE